MNRLENLHEVASRQLAGLEAGPNILAKAKLQAAEMRAPKQRGRVLKPVLAICTALALCVGAAVWSTQGVPPAVITPAPTENVMDSHAAGNVTEPTVDPRQRADVPTGSITMSAGGQRTGDTLFATGQGSSFPLITIGGATYRMLVSPNGISASRLGDELGAVSEFNVEPALGSGGIVSNAVARGETVYAINGMSGALVAAPVDGSLRVFQRVSYAGSAIIGSETLGDTLCDPADVEWLELAGVGRVDDVETAQRLMQTMLDYADYQSTGMSGKGSLQIGLSNGLTLQLLVGEDTVSACGTWSCPDFFEAFAAE